MNNVTLSAEVVPIEGGMRFDVMGEGPVRDHPADGSRPRARLDGLDCYDPSAGQAISDKLRG